MALKMKAGQIILPRAVVGGKMSTFYLICVVLKNITDFYYSTMYSYLSKKKS